MTGPEFWLVWLTGAAAGALLGRAWARHGNRLGDRVADLAAPRRCDRQWHVRVISDTDETA